MFEVAEDPAEDDVIQQAAVREGGDPDPLRGVTCIANARGGTYGWVGDRLFGNLIAPAATDAFDPKANIYAGARLIRRVLDRFPDPDPATACRAKTWLSGVPRHTAPGP